MMNEQRPNGPIANLLPNFLVVLKKFLEANAIPHLTLLSMVARIFLWKEYALLLWCMLSNKHLKMFVYSTYDSLTLWECEWSYEISSSCIQYTYLKPLQTGFYSQVIEVRNLFASLVKYRYPPSKVTQWNLLLWLVLYNTLCKPP